MNRECEVYNCADFARKTIDGRHYCATHARKERERAKAEQYVEDNYFIGGSSE